MILLSKGSVESSLTSDKRDQRYYRDRLCPPFKKRTAFCSFFISIFSQVYPLSFDKFEVPSREKSFVHVIHLNPLDNNNKKKPRKI